MSTLLPILALALALAAALLSRQSSEQTPERGRAAASIWAIAVGLLLLLIAFIWKGWAGDPEHVALGMFAGIVGVVLCKWLPTSSRVLSSIGLAAACEGFILLAPADWRLLAQVGAVAGAALGAWLLEVRSKTSLSTAIFPIALSAAMAADLLGSRGMTAPGFVFSGTLMEVATCAAGVVALLVTMKAEKAIYRQSAAVLLMIGAVYLIGWKYLQLPEVWMLIFGGIGVGIAVNWLVDDDGEDAARPLISTVLWIGLATMGFGLEKGYGMALGMIGGAMTLLLLGNVRALLTMGVFAALVMYRVFWEVHPDATRALDIGQHYALIGLTIGALAPLMPVEWLRARSEATGIRLPAAGVLWMFLLAVLPVGCAMVLGPKGVVGFVAGLGFGAIIEALRRAPSLQSLSLAVGLSATTTFSFQFLGDNTTLTRDEKIGILVPLTISLLVIAGLLALMSPKATKSADLKGALAK